MLAPGAKSTVLAFNSVLSDISYAQNVVNLWLFFLQNGCMNDFICNLALILCFYTTNATKALHSTLKAAHLIVLVMLA